MKMIKLTVSGSFKTEAGSDKNRRAFSNIEIIAPFSTEDYFITHAMRLFPIVHKTNKEIKDVNFEGLIKIYIDDYCEVEAENPCVGKDIKEMTWAELQYLACTMRFREIPLYQVGDLRNAREKAYETYMKVYKKRKVIKTPLDKVKLKEKLLAKYKLLGSDDAEANEQVEKELEEAFDMSINEHNPSLSYNFAKLPKLVPVPAEIEVKKVGRPVGS